MVESSATSATSVGSDLPAPVFNKVTFHLLKLPNSHEMLIEGFKVPPSRQDRAVEWRHCPSRLCFPRIMHLILKATRWQALSDKLCRGESFRWSEALWTSKQAGKYGYEPLPAHHVKPCQFV